MLLADRQYTKFVMGTVLKLALFLGLCGGAYYASGRFLHYPFDRIVPVASAFVITAVFLLVVERDRRSFFAKGYLLENAVMGSLWGLGCAVFGPLIGLAFKTRYFYWNADPDINGILFDTLSSGTLYAVIIFGYFFHIIRYDFGAVPAVIISSVAFGLLCAYGTSQGLITHNILIPAAAYYAVIGAAAGMLILQLGDVRSAVIFIFIYSFISELAETFTRGGRSFFTDVTALIMAVLCGLAMYLEMYFERKKKEKNLEI